MQDDVEGDLAGADGDHHFERVALTKVAEPGRGARDRRGLLGADEVRDRAAEQVLRCPLEHVADVGRDLCDGQVRFTGDDEDASRLDAAGDVDRFARAVVEIDRRADLDELGIAHVFGVPA